MSVRWSHRRRAGTNERGSALVGVLLLLLMMSALAAALTVNSISGTVSITYNGGLGTGIFTVAGWRDVR